MSRGSGRRADRPPGVEGVETRSDGATVAAYSYDASSYRVTPRLVAFPAGVDDVRAVLETARRHDLPVTARGGGTSMAGNAVGEGIVIDLSRRMNRVLEVDVAGRSVRLEPGVVLDDLNRRLADHGLEFAPDPSSHSRATVGGMVGNDACGNHSVAHGRTSDHILELDLVLADGAYVRATRGGVVALDDRDVSVGAAEHLERELRSIASDHLATLRTELGRIPRQVSGFQLHRLLPENGFDVARALVGSEGTCAVIVAAKVSLVARTRAEATLVLGYRDLIAAADDVPRILEAAPSAVEALDERIVTTLRERRGDDSVAGLPQGTAWLIVEIQDDDAGRDDGHDRLYALASDLRARGRLVDFAVVTDGSERSRLWRVREDGAGLTARPSDGRITWAGWEDAAVAPDRLGSYLRDFCELMGSRQITGVMYGHFGAGCVHVRLDFDLETAEGRRRMAVFVREAATIVASHGGTVSGEHGDGRARSELLPLMYSADALEAFRRFKRAFDPSARLNPGIVVDPVALDRDVLAPGGRGAAPPGRTVLALHQDGGSFARAVGRCIGVGRCRADAGGFMCPSFRASGEELDSTRGRARVLQEMVDGRVVTDGWRSTEVREALDLCLSCKACSTDCPVGVDIAAYKSEFSHHHYRRRLRPRSHYSLGWLPVWLRLAGMLPAVSNWVLRSRVVGRLMRWAGGVTQRRELPTVHSWRSSRPPSGQRRRAGHGEPVVLFRDTFTRAFRPGLVGDALEVLDSTGRVATPAPDLCCGLTWITTGQLGVARRILRRTVRVLDESGDADIVVLEPSCASALRADVPELLASDAARRVAGRVRTLSEVIGQAVESGWVPPALDGEALLQTHCHEHATFGSGTSRAVAQALGLRVEQVEGCCGLAGNFGFEASHYDTSMAVAEQGLGPRLRAMSRGSAVIADGFSCGTQIDHVLGQSGRASHIATVVARALPAQRTRP
ncbi:FAD-binding and (Fe-S)-binding domain-containing protein [Nocardioides humi]|uniref:FAD-binding and (Fe-S)-binding domain-containing protein n=1 Tax=Nocardioides humi TaxID=449461 RepID=A0ABN2A5Y0_9ACTN|nr:FAD-binding and (Fe-S)-binding domain-containing protein [Nocardioides humi]